MMTSSLPSAINGLAQRALNLARKASPQDPWSELQRSLGPMLCAPLWRTFRASIEVCSVEPTEPTRDLDDVVETLGDEARRHGGVYPTPTLLAQAMVEFVDAGDVAQGSIVDLSAGTGALLRAAITRYPQLTAIGVELVPELAVAAAIGLWEVRLARGEGAPMGDRIYCGDGLRQPTWWEEAPCSSVIAVIGNPPYVGEKGRRDYFVTMRREHPHLAAYFAARMDLLYLFFHRGLDVLATGGKLVYLTSEYWLTATGATKLRQDLMERAVPRHFVRFDKAGVFRDAPGHHSLITVLERKEPGATTPWNCRASTVVSTRGRDANTPWLEGPDARSGHAVPPDAFDERHWTPFLEPQRRHWHEQRASDCTLLGELVRDQQGFVSGADRLSARHARLLADMSVPPPEGSPIFIIGAQDRLEIFEALGEWTVRPLLRGSQIEAGRVYFAAPEGERVLYVDGGLPEEHEAFLEDHLGAFRPILAQRREVRSGMIPWYRLHWPRRRRDQVGPKLVTPRRASRPTFCLDLSGSAISSDCTYLVAPAGIDDPIRYLTAVMMLLNSEQTAMYLEGFGKRKGGLFEFYSEPLQRIPLPVRRVDSGLELVPALWTTEQAQSFWASVDAALSW
jgi:adenine-specific DNA-methyltransferase